jgi:DNA-binding NarL/FixJ family response regulator
MGVEDPTRLCAAFMITTLLVEDNQGFRRTLRSLLEARFPSMRIDEAGDGLEALKKIGLQRPDLIFLDIKLPGESGLEITKKIKYLAAETTIVILTSYDLPEYRRAARKNGANYFVSKSSTTPDEIFGLVKTVFTKSAGNRGAD